jgi:methyl-accepting chemotaxis protein
MDETTQQNAAVVEETTSAAQSMRDQAVELQRQLEAFKINRSEDHRGNQAHVGNPLVKREAQHLGANPAVKLAAHTGGLNPAFRRAAPAAKPVETKEAVGVGESYGKDRRRKEDEFGEF